MSPHDEYPGRSHVACAHGATASSTVVAIVSDVEVLTFARFAFAFAFAFAVDARVAAPARMRRRAHHSRTHTRLPSPRRRRRRRRRRSRRRRRRRRRRCVAQCRAIALARPSHIHTITWVYIYFYIAFAVREHTHKRIYAHPLCVPHPYIAVYVCLHTASRISENTHVVTRIPVYANNTILGLSMRLNCIEFPRIHA